MKTLKVNHPYNGMLAVKDYLLTEKGNYILSCEGKTQIVSYPEEVLIVEPISSRVHLSQFGGRSYKLVYFRDKREDNK